MGFYNNKSFYFKRQINEIKKQLSDEKHQLSVLTARLQKEIEDYQNSIVDARVKKLQFDSRKGELELRLKELDQTVFNIETRRSNVDARIEVLKNDVLKTKDNHQKLESELTKKVQKLEPIKAGKTEEYEEKNKKLHNMKIHTEDMKKKIEVMAESKAVMTKTIEKSNIEIADLRFFVCFF